MSDIDADFDRPERRRSSNVVLVLAVVFLAILGASVGVILGTAKNGDGNTDVTTTGPDTETPSPTRQNSTAASATGTGGTTGTRKPQATPTKTYPPVSGNDCPQQSNDAVGMDLHLELYIRTAKSEVWICSGGGNLYYQGHTLNKSFPSANDDVGTLFLRNVQSEGESYIASNGSTMYWVNRETLRIEQNGTELSNEPVEESYP